MNEFTLSGVSLPDRSSEPSSGGTVLVVEDNTAMNQAISEILRLEGYRVISAHDGVEALAVLKEERPDVVISDIMMPTMDGYELLRRTRQDPRLRTLPFIFLTARSSPEDHRMAKQIGIEDYLVKPVDAQDLLLAVSNALRRARDIQAEMKEQVDDLRNRILATLQHEFRTPLTFILGYAEYLANSAEQPEEGMDVDVLREAVQAILEGGHRLQDLIEKFLLLADLQHRRDLADISMVLDPWGTVQEVVARMAPQAQEAGLTIELQPPETRLQVLGVPDLIGKAVQHLVENALRYRRAESRRVEVCQIQHENFVGLAVQDEGLGIPPTLLEQLSRPFEQAHRENQTLSGAGLGLAIVRHIARLHGGALTIESQEGRGSTFTLWLPHLK